MVSKDNVQKPPSLNSRKATYLVMLSEEVSRRLKQFHLQHSLQDSDCLLRFDDHGPRGEIPPIIPYAPFRRSRVFTGTRQGGLYNQHPQLGKFKDKYFFAFSNGRVNEEDAGQRILISSSNDAITWSSPNCLVGDRNDKGIAHCSMAIKNAGDKLYVVAKKEDTIIDAAAPGMRRINPETQQLSVYESEDGKDWKKVFDFTDQLMGFFEDPEPTTDGNLLAIATLKSGPAFLRWPGENLCEHPEVISVPPPPGTEFPYGEGSWYQTKDGTIIAFWRDEGQSCRVWVNYSTDGGRTFSELAMTDIPDSMSRVYVGRLRDGRFFLCNNAFPTLLNRMYLFLMLSDDGYVFNRVYLLIDDPTAQRAKGLLKADGYQYPCCVVEDGRLLVGYSVNKEDIECGIVDVESLQ